jgi:hypothetical protein
MGWGRTRIVASAVTLLALAIVLCNTFWWDKQDELGHVPIPGKGRVHLPQGSVDIGFDAFIYMKRNEHSVPVPPLKLWLSAPSGVPQADVVVTPVSASPQFSNSSAASLWTAKIPVAGHYAVKVEGDVGGFDEPRLVFGTAPHWTVEALYTVFGILLTIGAMLHITWFFQYLSQRGKRRATGT